MQSVRLRAEQAAAAALVPEQGKEQRDAQERQRLEAELADLTQHTTELRAEAQRLRQQDLGPARDNQLVLQSQAAAMQVELGRTLVQLRGLHSGPRAALPVTAAETN